MHIYLRNMQITFDEMRTGKAPAPKRDVEPQQIRVTNPLVAWALNFSCEKYLREAFSALTRGKTLVLRHQKIDRKTVALIGRFATARV